MRTVGMVVGGLCVGVCVGVCVGFVLATLAYRARIQPVVDEMANAAVLGSNWSPGRGYDLQDALQRWRRVLEGD